MSTPAEQRGPSPERFFSAINSYQLTEAIKSAIELEVFTAVSERQYDIGSDCEALPRNSTWHTHTLRFLGHS
jgi:UTP-glucose-1-phosphate uridylyltransferase